MFTARTVVGDTRQGLPGGSGFARLGRLPFAGHNAGAAIIALGRVVFGGEDVEAC